MNELEVKEENIISFLWVVVPTPILLYFIRLHGSYYSLCIIQSVCGLQLIYLVKTDILPSSFRKDRDIGEDENRRFYLRNREEIQESGVRLCRERCIRDPTTPSSGDLIGDTLGYGSVTGNLRHGFPGSCHGPCITRDTFINKLFSLFQRIVTSTPFHKDLRDGKENKLLKETEHFSSERRE